jgi:hypothetical protein
MVLGLTAVCGQNATLLASQYTTVLFLNDIRPRCIQPIPERNNSINLKTLHDSRIDQQPANIKSRLPLVTSTRR